MRLWPDEVFLMALQGWKSLHGRPFISKEEALENPKRLTGQDFGYDDVRWAEWLRWNRHSLYGPGEQGGLQ
jgi:hypothetical protein